MHPLYRALKELGRVYKTVFVLRYLDELPLRQNTEKMLNRIEQSHQFAKAVFFGNSQEFKHDTKGVITETYINRHFIHFGQIVNLAKNEFTKKGILL